MNSAIHSAERWLPLVRAAELLGGTPLNVLMHVRRGLLVGVEEDGGWLVEPGSLAALLQKRHDEGVPAVCISGCGKKPGGCGNCA